MKKKKQKRICGRYLDGIERAFAGHENMNKKQVKIKNIDLSDIKWDEIGMTEEELENKKYSEMLKKMLRTLYKNTKKGK